MNPLFAPHSTSTVSDVIFNEVVPTSSVPKPLTVITPKPLVSVRQITDQDIDGLGQRVANHASTVATQIMASVKTSDVDGFGEKLNELISTAKQLDPKKMGDKGMLSRITNLFGNAKEKLLSQYETVEGRMNTLVAEMDKTADKQRQRILDLDQMFVQNHQAYLEYGEEAANAALMSEALQAMLGAEQTATDTFSAQRQQDIQDRLDRVDKKIDDFQRSQKLCELAAPEIRMMQSNARALATTFSDIKVTTIPAWQGVFSRFIMSMEQKKAAELATSVHDATNEAFRMQADQLRLNVQEVAKVSQRSVVDIETLEHMQQQLVGAVDDVKRIVEEGRRGRQEAKLKLAGMEQQLIQRFAVPQITN